MYHCTITLIAGIIATVFVGGIAMSIPAEAAKLSEAERVALEKATAACREEAKAMKLSWHWLKHRKYVKNCIIRTTVRVRSQRRHPANPQGGEYEESPVAATRGMGM